MKGHLYRVSATVKNFVLMDSKGWLGQYARSTTATEHFIKNGKILVGIWLEYSLDQIDGRIIYINVSVG